MHWTELFLSVALCGSVTVWAPQLTISETALVCVQLFVVGFVETMGGGWAPL